jgi:hypothetical protein
MMPAREIHQITVNGFYLPLCNHCQEFRLSDQEFDGRHAVSSTGSTSGGDSDCKIVDNESSDGIVDDQCQESAILSNQSDPAEPQYVPPPTPKETGSGKVISNCI